MEKPHIDEILAFVQNSPYVKWGRRFFDKGWWELIPDWPDEETVARGYSLATQPRSLTGIPREEWPAALKILGKPSKLQSSQEKSAESRILSKMPFGPRIGYIDIDIADNHAPDAASRARAYAVTMTRCLQEAGLGTPDWFQSGAKGGLHGEVKGPPGVWTDDAPRTILEFLENAAERCHVPYANTGKIKPSDVYFDGSPLNRGVDNRGGTLRLPGSKKPGGKPKVRIDLGVGSHTFANEAAFLALIDEYQSNHQQMLRDSLNIIRKRNPMPIASDKILNSVAKTIHGMNISGGSRHYVRLGVAGWLLKAHVPDGVVVGTLEACLPSHDSPIDCKSVVETTAHRIDSGVATMGLKKLVTLHHLTGDQATSLQNALEEDIFADVSEADRPKKEDKKGWRHEDLDVIREALSILQNNNPNKKLKIKNPGQDQLFAASHCGSFKLAKVCDDCQAPFSISVMRCWRNICLSCASLRSNGWATWVREVWKKAIEGQDTYYVKIPVPDGKLDYESAVNFRDKLLRGIGKSDARRSWVAPGYVFITISAGGAMRFNARIPQGSNLTKISSVYTLSAIIGQCKMDVLNHLGAFVTAKDSQGLANDSWLRARKLVSSNKAGNQLFPWFDDALLRSFLASRKDKQGCQAFISAIIEACQRGGSAEKKAAAKAHREAHAEDCPCPKCGPFSTFHYEAVHVQTKQLIIKTITGDPAPTYMAVAKQWNRMQRAVVSLPPPTVGYGLELAGPAKSRF